MKVEFVINGGVTAVLCPESPMEEEVLKTLVKQKNEIIEVRTPVNVLAKTIRGSVLICKSELISHAIGEQTPPEAPASTSEKPTEIEEVKKR